MRFTNALSFSFFVTATGHPISLEDERLLNNANSKSNVAVIGAGVSGLTAAYSLKKLGYSVTVFEAEDRVGGKIKSIYLEDGLPTNQLLDLTDGMEIAAQALCGDRRPTDLGALYSSAGSQIQALADELGVPYGTVSLDTKIIVALNGNTLMLTPTEYLGFLATQIDPDAPEAVIADAFAAYQTVVQAFPEMLMAKLDGNHPDLALPTTKFAAKHGISLLVEATRPLLAGWGYAYYETVPAAYMMKLIVIVLAGVTDPGALIGFPCGYDSLLRAMAATVDVRLNAKVKKVKVKRSHRKSRKLAKSKRSKQSKSANEKKGKKSKKRIKVKAKNQPAQYFDYLVTSTTLDQIPRYMKVSKEERKLFRSISYYRYLASVVNIKGLQGDTESTFYADQGFPSNTNHVGVINKGDAVNNAKMSYQILDETITTQDAYKVLKNDMETYWGVTDTEMILQLDVTNYFPTVSSKDFAAGFYDSVDKLQGKDNIFYVGSQFSFEVVRMTERFARELVLDKFSPVGK